jgi:hypothetical protein
MSVIGEKTADATAIRPFRVETSQEVLDDLRRRIAGTRFPEKETVDDATQGVQLATMEKLVRRTRFGPVSGRCADERLRAAGSYALARRGD